MPASLPITVAPFEHALEDERRKREQSQQRRNREGGDEIIFVVQYLDMEWHRVGLAPDVAGDDRHRAKLAHGSSVAEEHAVKEPPANVGQGDPPESLPATGAERQRR